MSPEQIESTTIQNALAIEKLTVVAERTSADVDKVVRHLDSIIPFIEKFKEFSERIETLETKSDSFLKFSTFKWVFLIIVSYMITFGIYVESYVQLNNTNITSHVEKSVEIKSTINKRLRQLESNSFIHQHSQ